MHTTTYTVPTHLFVSNCIQLLLLVGKKRWRNAPFERFNYSILTNSRCHVIVLSTWLFNEILSATYYRIHT